MKKLKLLSLLLLVLTSSLAHAGEEVIDGKSFIHNFLNDFNNISKPTTQDINAFIDNYYDSQSLLDRSVVDFKDQLTVNQKKEFYNLFGLLLKEKLSLERVSWNRYFKNCVVESAKKENAVEKVVVTSMLDQGKTIKMTFFLMKGLKGYKIVDLDVEGALLSRNFRAQFGRIFNEEGYQGIYTRLTERLKQASL